MCFGEARGLNHCLEFLVSFVALICMLLSVVIKSGSQLDWFRRMGPRLIFICSSVPTLNISAQDGSINIVEGKKELWEGR